MSRQSRGLKYEHELASDIYEASGGRIFPLRSGWSGNQGIPSPDLLIPFSGSLRALELKTFSSKRHTVEPEDIKSVAAWVKNQKEVETHAYLGVKPTHYAMYVGRLNHVSNLKLSLRDWASRCPMDTNITKSGNLTIGHPTHYDHEWKSERASDGSEYEVIDVLSEDQRTDLVGVSTVLRQEGFHPME